MIGALLTVGFYVVGTALLLPLHPDVIRRRRARKRRSRGVR